MAIKSFQKYIDFNEFHTHFWDELFAIVLDIQTDSSSIVVYWRFQQALYRVSLGKILLARFTIWGKPD